MKFHTKYLTVILFTLSTTIWGTSWFVIKFQITEVTPILSTSFRFILAGSILITFCLISKRNLRFSVNDHLFLLFQGLCLFGINYWLVYSAECYISSGVMAVLFSTLIFFNIFFNRIIRKQKSDGKTIIAALAGISGTIIIFVQELIALNFSNHALQGLGLGLMAIIIVSLGNIISVKIQERDIEIVSGTALAMSYGGIATFLIALAIGQKIDLTFSYLYLSALLYLSVFASIIAFISYLKLIGMVGVDKAAYVLIMIPAISILISIVFENFEFNLAIAIGLILIIVGSITALKFNG